MAMTSQSNAWARPDQITADAHSPAYQANQILQWGFVVLPSMVGVDTFAGVLASWDKYLAPAVADQLPNSAHPFMMMVGVIEFAAGLLVAIIGNLLLLGGYFDVALRDLGLCLGALALGRLSLDFDAPTRSSHS